MLCNLCFVLGFASIIASVYIWLTQGGMMNTSTSNMMTLMQYAQGERFAIYVGLWAPTFFLLSGHLRAYAMSCSCGTNNSNMSSNQSRNNKDQNQPTYR